MVITCLTSRWQIIFNVVVSLLLMTVSLDQRKTVQISDERIYITWRIPYSRFLMKNSKSCILWQAFLTRHKASFQPSRILTTKQSLIKLVTSWTSFRVQTMRVSFLWYKTPAIYYQYVNDISVPTDLSSVFHWSSWCGDLCCFLIFGYRTSLAPPLFIIGLKSARSCNCVFGISILPSCLEFSIEFWNCSNVVVCFPFHYLEQHHTDCQFTRHISAK